MQHLILGTLQDLIEVHKSCEKLVLIHLPVQSGSNKILEAMNRKFSRRVHRHFKETYKS